MAKYCKEIVEEICGYIRDGFSNENAARKVGIAEETFYAWKREKTEFSEAIKEAERYHLKIRGKDVVESLFKRARGYDVEETETLMIPDKKGKPQVKTQKVRKKHIPADPTAAKFLLTNLYPDEWQDKQRNELTGSLSNKVTIEYVDSGVDLAHSEDEITD